MDYNTELYLKNAYSRGFGYYVEVLYCNHLSANKIPFVHESVDNVNSLPNNIIDYFSNKFREGLLNYNPLLNLFAYHFPNYFNYDSNEPGKKITDFDLKVWTSNDLLLDLVKTNFVEIIRYQNGHLSISEIKGSWGPSPKNKITISFSELLKLLILNDLGIHTSLIYVIALDNPRFVEVPLKKLHLPLFPEDYIEMLAETVPTINEAGRLDRYSRFYYTHNLTIPAEFRNSMKPLGSDEKPIFFPDIIGLIKTIESVSPAYYLPARATKQKINELLSIPGNR